MKSMEFASLLCSRLCHDLMSPIGALNNGLELLGDEQDSEMRERCLELVAESARASANKLKFFRLASGAGGGFGDQVDTGEARAALEGMFGPERQVEVGWLVAEPKLSKGALKLLLNLALIAGDALVRGGRLDVGAEQGEGGVEIAIRADGPRLVLDESVRRCLSGSPTPGEVEPRVAGALLARSLADEGGGTIQLSDPNDEVLVIGATLRR